MHTCRAAVVVVDHDPVANSGDVCGHARADGSDDPGRLMPADDAALHPHLRVVRRPVELQVTPAHARSLDFHNNLAYPGRRIIDVEVRKFLVAQEYHAPHSRAPYFCGVRFAARTALPHLSNSARWNLSRSSPTRSSGSMPATPWTSATFLVFRAFSSVVRIIATIVVSQPQSVAGAAPPCSRKSLYQILIRCI